MPQEWGKVAVSFTVEETGAWSIELEAPSAAGAAGRAWVDDLSLVETALPPRIAVTDDEHFNERPVLAFSAEQVAYCALISFRNGQDVIRVGRLLNAASENPEVVMLPDLNLADCEGISRLAMAPLKQGAWLAGSCEVAENWDIYLWKIGPEGAAAPIRVTTDPATDINPTLAAAGGRIFLAWETNRGPRRIMVVEVSASGVGEATQVSTPETWNYHPCIAGHASGRAWLVWEIFREGNYDIYGAPFDGQAWGAERVLSADPRIEHRPVVTFGQDGPWMAWEVMTYNYPVYRPGAAQEQRVVAARLDDDGLKSTQGVHELFKNLTQQATITSDSSGRVYVCARESRGWWATALRVFNGEAWSEGPSLSLKPMIGRAQPSALAVAGQHLLIAVQDVLMITEKGVRPRVEKSNIALLSLDIDAAPRPVASNLTAFTLPQTDFDMPGQRNLYGEDRPAQSIRYGDDELHLLWGQFHEHSDISQCVRSADLCPDDNYAYHRDIHKMDFCAVTDHGYNQTAATWHELSKVVRTQHDPSAFVTFLGQEWTSEPFHKGKDKHPIYGHRNIIFADPKCPRWFDACDGESPTDIWAELRRMKTDFIQIPHQLADAFCAAIDWRYVDEEAQPVAEIFQARGSYEYRGCPRQAGDVVEREGHFLQEAWAKGVVIGVIASPDHRGGLGKAAVFAPERTRKAILDACRRRHTYGTSGAKIFLDMRVNGRLMGEKLQAHGKPVRIHVETVGTLPLERVEICRSNTFVYSRECDSEKCTFDWEDPDPLPGVSYYYVRVTQRSAQIVRPDDDKDRKRPSLKHVPELAWSSPVWVER
jgi:hypothetical protein